MGFVKKNGQIDEEKDFGGLLRLFLAGNGISLSFIAGHPKDTQWVNTVYRDSRLKEWCD